MSLDSQWIRSHFPSVQNSDTVFLDNPGGTQVTQAVIDAFREYLETANANHGGLFPTSERSDAMVQQARRAFADFLNAPLENEIVFGPNMTTLTFTLARALGRWLHPGDEIIVTRLDHDANIAPWVALEERGVVVKRVDINPDDCTLNMADFEKQLSEKTRVVAVGLASNAVGTVNPVREIADLAHMAGALVYADAVAYAPHYPLDVQALNVDFLVCSAYKFYGPHLGVLYGKYDLLDRLHAYKVRPAENTPPHKFETGTPSFESIHAAAAAINYLASVGEKFGAEYASAYPQFSGRRLHLKTAMRATQAYEKNLFARLFQGLRELPDLTFYGIANLSRFDYRAPTATFNLRGKTPQTIARALGSHNINVWDGNYYALALMERLDLERTGGAVRIGLAQYNTAAEIDRLLQALHQL